MPEQQILTGSVLGKPRHMINLAILSVLKHREDMIKVAFYEAESVRHFWLIWAQQSFLWVAW